jgi:RNA polymerase-binding protein DksA
MAPKALRNAQMDLLKRAIAKRYGEMLLETREDVERARQETFGELAGGVTDEADRASADVLADLDQAEVSRDVRELQRLEGALARIAEGTFGNCADCGAEIELERLRAYPIALRCVRCERARERTHAQALGPRL